MSSLIVQTTFQDDVSTVTVGRNTLRVLPLQMIIWASLAAEDHDAFDPRVSCFPAVFDTGFNGEFLIHKDQLQSLAGFSPSNLRKLDEALRAPGRLFPLYAADLWLHRSKPDDAGRLPAPFLLQLHRGIAVSSDADGYPRLPLLGQRSLRQARLQAHIDYRNCLLAIRAYRRFWPFS